MYRLIIWEHETIRVYVCLYKCASKMYVLSTNIVPTWGQINIMDIDNGLISTFQVGDTATEEPTALTGCKRRLSPALKEANWSLLVGR